MERWLPRIADEIGLEGRQGCTEERLWHLADMTRAGLLLDDYTKTHIRSLLARHPDIAAADTFTLQQEARRHLLAEGRLIRLSDFAWSVLEQIGQCREAGIAQSDLARALGTDPRTLFHHLKPLLRHELITRIPIAFKKTFTYQCVLTRFLDEGTQGHGFEGGRVLTTAEMSKMIMEVLEGTRTMTLTGVFARLGLPQKSIKQFRRVVLKLVVNGNVDVMSASELGGQNRILRFKRSLDAASAGKGVQVRLPPYGEMLTRHVGLEQQVRDFIHASGARGTLLKETRHAFGLPGKLAFRIYQKLCEPKLMLAASDVIKQTEFEGKERHHRLFTRAGIEAGSRDASARPDSPILSDATPTTLQRDSVTRQKRQEIVLKLLQEMPVLEVGRTLAATVQHLQNQTAIMDLKTLKRTIASMEATGLVRTIIVVPPSGPAKMLAVRQDLELDDERVAKHLRKIKESAIPVFVAPPDTQAGVGEKTHKPMFEIFGFVHGIMARCRTLHLYLFRTLTQPTFETVTVLFRRLPLDIFLALVGIAEHSETLGLILESVAMRARPLEELPRAGLEEIQRRRSARHRAMVRQMLQILTDVGVLMEDAQFPSAGFRIPFQHTLLSRACLGSAIFALDHEQGIQAFWDHLQSSASEKAQLPARTMALVGNPENWLERHPMTRRICNRVRKMVESDGTAEQLEDALQRMAADFELPLSDLRQVVHEVGSELLSQAPPIKRKAPSKPRKRTKRIKTKMMLEQWSEAQARRAQILFVLLHQKQFLGDNGSVNWKRTEGVIDGRSVGDIRSYCLKVLVNDYSVFVRLLQIELQMARVDVVGREARTLKQLVDLYMDTLPNEQPAIHTSTASVLWSSWHRVRHSRRTNFAVFLDLPSTLFSVPDAVRPGDELAAAMRTLKMLLATAPLDYEPSTGLVHLSRFSESVLQTAVDTLIAQGLLVKPSNRTRHRRRVPGSTLMASDRLTELLETATWTGGSCYAGVSCAAWRGHSAGDRGHGSCGRQGLCNVLCGALGLLWPSWQCCCAERACAQG